MSVSLEQIIEAGIDELVEIKVSNADASGHEPGAGKVPKFEAHYAEVCLAFLRADLKSLENLVQQSKVLFTSGEDRDLFILACQLRLCIRLRTFDPALLREATVKVQMKSRWQGELSILTATLLTVYERFAEAKDLFAISAVQLREQGCLRKSLRGRMNVLVCESHLNPEKNLIAGYHDLYRASLKKNQRDLTVATTCLLNISREFQRTGALLSALKYCTKALTLAEFQFGSLSHHLLVAHRAHVLCELRRHSEAQIDLDFLSVTEFPEVQAAVAVVRSLLDSDTSDITLAQTNLLPTWRERLNNDETLNTHSRFVLSEQEQKLVSFLAKGPRDRVDILEHLYGTALSYETKLNRLKSLLSSLRKKSPELVRYENDSYLLNDELHLPLLKRHGE